MLYIESLEAESRYYSLFNLVSEGSPLISNLLKSAECGDFDIFIDLEDRIDGGENAGRTQPCLYVERGKHRGVYEIGYDLREILDNCKGSSTPTYGIHIVLAKEVCDPETREFRKVTQGEFAATIIHELVIHGVKMLSVIDDYKNKLPELIDSWPERRKMTDLSCEDHHEDARNPESKIGKDFADAVKGFFEHCVKKMGKLSSIPQDQAQKKSLENVAIDALTCYKIDTGLNILDNCKQLLLSKGSTPIPPPQPHASSSKPPPSTENSIPKGP